MTIIFAAIIIASTLAYAIRDAANIIAEALDGLTVGDDEEDEPAQPWES